MPALLDQYHFILKLHPGRPRLYHRFHQFKRIEHTPETRLRVRHDGRELIRVTVVARILAFHQLDLLAARQGVVDSAHYLRHAISRIQPLVGEHFVRAVGGLGTLTTQTAYYLETQLA